jgi:hypothetical protein
MPLGARHVSFPPELIVIALCAVNDTTSVVLKYPEIGHQSRPADPKLVIGTEWMRFRSQLAGRSKPLGISLSSGSAVAVFVTLGLLIPLAPVRDRHGPMRAYWSRIHFHTVTLRAHWSDLQS